MRAASKEFRKLMNELLNHGLIVNIIHVGKSNYNFVVNGEIIKNYKKRESANKRLIKMHKSYGNN